MILEQVYAIMLKNEATELPPPNLRRVSNLRFVNRLVRCGAYQRNLMFISYQPKRLGVDAHTSAPTAFYYREEQFMPVLRKNKQSNYTVIDNGIFKDKGLSLKAKGLLCQMLSLPDNWNYSLEGLVTLSSDGISSVRSALKELENHMYFKRRRLYEDGKLAGVEYIVSETPMCENLILENLKQENLILENPPQLSTNTNKVKKESKKNIFADVPEEIRGVFMEWVKMRKSLKKPLTSKLAVTRALNELNKLSQDPQEQAKLIEYAIYKCWLGFYPMKAEKAVRNENRPPEPPKYKEFKPEEKVDTVEMPQELRDKYKGFISEL